MTTRYLFSASPLFLLTLCLILGCGSSKSAPAQLSGTVTYKGAPVTGGSLAFHYDAGVYTAVINADGTYTAVDLPEGEMIVTVETEKLNPERKAPVYNEKTAGGGKNPKPAPGAGGKKQETSPMPDNAPQSNPGQYVKIPLKYNDKTKSPLRATLKAGKQEHNIELND